eukprot:249188_1
MQKTNHFVYRMHMYVIICVVLQFTNPYSSFPHGHYSINITFANNTINVFDHFIIMPFSYTWHLLVYSFPFALFDGCLPIRMAHCCLPIALQIRTVNCFDYFVISARIVQRYTWYSLVYWLCPILSMDLFPPITVYHVVFIDRKST